MKKPIISHHVASAASGLRHVFVRDLELMALIGIYDHEKRDAQRIIVNIDLSVQEVPIEEVIRRVFGRQQEEHRLDSLP
jgi:dihydroneopterin aldolase